jgi:hypothetical protein
MRSLTFRMVKVCSLRGKSGLMFVIFVEFISYKRAKEFLDGVLVFGFLLRFLDLIFEGGVFFYELV